MFLRFVIILTILSIYLDGFIQAKNIVVSVKSTFFPLTFFSVGTTTLRIDHYYYYYQTEVVLSQGTVPK